MRVLRELAGDRDIEAFIADLVAERLDPKRRVEVYLELHNAYLREAEGLYARGDLVQAGEKYWGAVTALLNAIAELRGWEHYSHRDYAVIVDRLYGETGDGELVVGFRLAEGLHANFYHNFMSKGEFDIHRDAVIKLMDKLRRLLEGR